MCDSSPEPAKPTAPQPPQQHASSLAEVEMPSQLPQGYTHFSMSRLELVMTPLPSLSITYTVSWPTQSTLLCVNW